MIVEPEKPYWQDCPHNRRATDLCPRGDCRRCPRLDMTNDRQIIVENRLGLNSVGGISFTYT